MITSLQLNSDMSGVIIKDNSISWDIAGLRFDSNSKFSVSSCFMTFKRPISTVVKVSCSLVEKDRLNNDGTIFWSLLDKPRFMNVFFVDYKPNDLVWWPIDCSNPHKLVLKFQNKTIIPLESVAIVLKIVENP